MSSGPRGSKRGNKTRVAWTRHRYRREGGQEGYSLFDRCHPLLVNDLEPLLPAVIFQVKIANNAPVGASATMPSPIVLLILSPRRLSSRS